MTRTVDEEPLSVLVATTTYPLRRGDFSGHFIHSLCATLVGRGHRVTVVAPHRAGSSEAEEIDGVAVRRFRYAPDALERVAYGDGIVNNIRRDARAVLTLPGFARALARATRAAARETRADVVHAQWGPTAALMGHAIDRRPMVVTLHGSDATLARKGGMWRALLERGVRHASRVVTVARDQADFIRDEGVFTGPVDVVPSGVPAALLERERPRRDPATPFTFAFAGRLMEGKGVRELTESFTRVVGTGADVRLVVIGAGPEEAGMRDRATAAGVAGLVDFRGALPHADALDAIAAADCFVLPSHAEGSPLSVTEALALGTPVIGSRVGGIPDLLGEDGRLFEAGDVDALTDLMVSAARDREGGEALAAAGRIRVAQGYTWERVALRHEEIYRAAIGAGSAEAGGGRG